MLRIKYFLINLSIIRGKLDMCEAGAGRLVFNKSEHNCCSRKNRTDQCFSFFFLFLIQHGCLLITIPNNIFSGSSAIMKARKYVVVKHFEGLPKHSDFELVEYELPPLKDGEMLLKTEYISVDSYLFEFNKDMPLPYDQFGIQSAVVIESKSTKYPAGTRVVTHNGWCDHRVVKDVNDEHTLLPDVMVHTHPDLKGLSPTYGVGAVGMTGTTAYFGLLDICKPKPGETNVVTGASGPIGSIVGQIAKIKGCRVIGFAGSDDKVECLEKEFGFDKALNYKTVEPHSALKAAAPNGVDCYFDCVGGELSSIIMGQMNSRGRVSICSTTDSGMDDISNMPRATVIQPTLIFKELRVEGYFVWRWWDRYSEAFEDLTSWMKSGQLKSPEQVVVGFENVIDAFLRQLSREKIVKYVVKI